MSYWETIVMDLITGVVTGTIALYLAARIAKIDNATIIVAFAVVLADKVLGGILFYINVHTELLMGVTGILSSIVVWILIFVLIKVLYGTTWLKAFIAWILYIVLYYVFYFVLLMALSLVFGF